MSKKLIALATMMVAAPVVAKADTANTNVYGTLNLSIENTQVSGSPSTPVTRWRAASNSSNFGFKGTEDLSTDLKGLYQVELGLAPATTAAPLTLRNTMLGAQAGFGTVTFGIWDTPYKTASAFMDPFYNTGVGFLQSLMDTVSGGSSSPSVWSGAGTGAEVYTFNRRQGNNFQYWSPTFAGTTFKGMMSFDPSKSGVALWSASLGYDEGPITAAIAYETHYNFVSNNNGRDMGLKAAAGYKLMDTTSINGQFTSLTYKTGQDTGETQYTKPAYAVSILHKMDAFTLRLGGALASKGTTKVGGTDVSSTQSDTAAKQLALGGSYSFSKRTDAYLVYSKIWNNAGAYNFMISGANPAVTAGTDPQSIGLGVRHAF